MTKQEDLMVNYNKQFIKKVPVNNPSIVIKAYDKKYLPPESKYVFSFLSKNIKDFNDLLRSKIYEMTNEDLYKYLNKLLGTKRLIKIKIGEPSFFSFASDRYNLYMKDNDYKKKIKIYIKLRDYIDFHANKVGFNTLDLNSTSTIILKIIYVYALKTMEALQENLIGTK